MTKQELIQAVKEIRDNCKERKICKWCPFCYIDDKGVNTVCVFDYPSDWEIEKLECESNNEET